MAFERIVEMEPAFDKRHPDPNKNYGIHGMGLRFVLKGEKGATNFTVYTNWHLPHVADELWSRPEPRFLLEPMGADIGYHDTKPHYDGQDTMDCTYVEGGKCYYDGSSLSASEFMPEFLAGGSDAVASTPSAAG